MHRTIRQHSRDTGDIEIIWHETRRQHGADFAGKHEPIGQLGNVERLDPERIAGEQHPTGARLVKRKRKHPLELLDRRLAPGGEGLQQHFRVARAAELSAKPLELAPQAAEVVDLAVEDQPVAGGGVDHRLMPGR